MSHESAKPCGCDPGAHWFCERHQPQDQPQVDTISEDYEDCISCDGYVLDELEAPYCPSCARERAKLLSLTNAICDASIAQAANLGGSTSYLVRLRDRSTGQTFEAAFNSMTERNIYIFETEHWATVEKEWTA